MGQVLETKMEDQLKKVLEHAVQEDSSGLRYLERCREGLWYHFEH